MVRRRQQGILTGMPFMANVSEKTFTDDAGRRVYLAKPARRVVSLAPSVTEILFAVGLESEVVGVTTFCDYPTRARSKPKIGSSSPNLEAILGLKPDLIVANKDFIRPDALAKLEQLKIPVFILSPKTVEDILGHISTVGRLVGRDKEARSVGQGLRDRTDNRQFAYMGLQLYHDREKRDQGHNRLHEAGAQIFHDLREAHRVFLDTLGSALDMAKPAPVRHEVIVHRRSPAEYPVTDDEGIDHLHIHANQRQPRKIGQSGIKLSVGRRSSPRHQPLHIVKEGTVPGVDRDTDLHVEIDQEEDKGRYKDGPILPGMRRIPAPEPVEDSHAKSEIKIKPQKRL